MEEVKTAKKVRTVKELKALKKKISEELLTAEAVEKAKKADDFILKYVRKHQEDPKLSEYWAIVVAENKAIEDLNKKVAAASENRKREIRKKFENDPNKATLPEPFKKLFG